MNGKSNQGHVIWLKGNETVILNVTDLKKKKKEENSIVFTFSPPPPIGSKDDERDKKWERPLTTVH